MKTLFATALLVLSCIAVAAQTWTQQPNLPGTPRYGAASTQTSTHGYVLGGETADGRTNECWSFEPTSQSWTQIAPYPGELRSKTVAFQYDDIVYYGLGEYNGVSDSLLYAYDPSADTWTEISGAPSGVNFWSASCFMIGSKAYIVTFSNHVVSYDCVTGAWEMLASFPGPARSTATAFSINGQGYYGLGYPIAPPFYNDFWKYDPVQDSWSEINGGFPGLPRYAAKGVASDSHGFIICGESQEEPVFNNDFWKFDPLTVTFTQLNSFPANRNYVSGFYLNNQLYAGCGGPGWSTEWWSIDPLQATPFSCQPLSGSLADGLVGYWPFCGNANDESGNGNDGVVNGATLTEDRFGNANSAYEFDGTDITIPLDNSHFQGDFTISVWTKINAFTSDYPMFIQGENCYFDLGYINSNAFANGQTGVGFSFTQGCGIGDYYGQVYREVNAYEWSHVTVISKQGFVYFYLNGQLVDLTEQPLEIQSNVIGNFLKIGYGYWSYQSFNGLVDDLAIYSRALSAEEVMLLNGGETQYYACSNLDGTLSEGLIGYWPLCGNAQDVSGNNNHGLAIGALPASDRFNNPTGALYLDNQLNYDKDWVKIPVDSALVDGDFSISVWTKLNLNNTSLYPLPSGYPAIIEGDRCFLTTTYDLYSPQYGIFGYYQSGSCNSEPSGPGWIGEVNPAEWVYLTIVSQADSTSLYLNGSIVITVDSPNQINGVGEFLKLGRGHVSQDLSIFNGWIDDLAIYNRALIPAEITSLYTGEPVVQPACSTLDPALQNGLVGYWPFCGNANDESGNGNDGVVNGATLTEDRFGNADAAYNFNGVDAQIQINNVVLDSGDFTIVGWLNSSEANGFDGTNDILGFGGAGGEESMSLELVNSDGLQNQLRFSFREFIAQDYNAISPSEITYDQWIFFTLMREGNLQKLYLNGELVDTTENVTTNDVTQTGTLYLGAFPEWYNFTGLLDDIGIWNRALTAEEVALLYGNFTQTIPGCTDPSAFNYNPQANQNEGCLYTASVFVYNDLNGNGEHESNEPGLANWPVVGNDINGLLWTNGNGNAFVTVPQGAYQFTVLNTTDNWVLTTDASGILSVGGNNCTDQAGNPMPCPISTLSFGLQVIPGEAIVAAGPFTGFWDILHCTDGYESGVYLENIGSQTVSGFMTLTCDPLFTPNASSYFTTPPVETGPGYALWNIEDFLPGEYELLSYFVPGPGVEYLNAVFNFSLELTLLDPQGNIIYDETWDSSPIVACAYDPNDLTGYPEGLSAPHEEGYTIEHFMRPDNMVEFRVRFQNTGTLPAEDIDIYIPIDASVWDLSTIEPLARAADMQVLCLHDGGDIDFSLYDSLEHELPEGVTASDLLIFSFDDIFLPDSASDPEGSQGYVFFQMQAKHGLDVNTELNAQAFIYFEQNPPITTNETYHVIFDCNSFTPMVGDAEICDGESLIFDATQPYVDAYEWQLNNVVIGSANTLQYPAEVGTYTLELNTKNVLCPQGENHDVTVIVHEIPELDLPLDATVCEGEELNYEAESNGSVTWSNGANTGDTFTADQSFTVTATALGEGNCSTSEDWSVTVNPLPSAAVDSANFVLTAIDGVAWQWYFNGQPIDAATSQSYTYEEAGNYYVVVTGEEGCTVQSETVVINPINVFVHSWSTLHLYPNPMSTGARLELPQGIFDITLYDITGACVRALSNQQGTVVIERASIASGVYQLQVRQGEVMKSVRLVVE